MVILLYIYIIIIENDQKAVNNMKVFLATCFNLEDLGQLKYFLEIKITHSKKGILINQHKYTLNILHEARLLCPHGLTQLVTA